MIVKARLAIAAGPRVALQFQTRSLSSSSVSRLPSSPQAASTSAPNSTDSSTKPKEEAKYDPIYDAPPLQPDLPRAHLRALVSLYHSASNFITPENLDAVIDREFATSNASHMGASQTRVAQTIGDINQVFRDRRDAPKLSNQFMPTEQSTKQWLEQDVEAKSWSSRNQTPKMAAVKATLWGVSVPSSLPGLESLEETLEQKRRQDAGKKQSTRGN